MDLTADILKLLDSEMTRPGLYGWFHILWLLLIIAATVLLCKRFPRERKSR